MYPDRALTFDTILSENHMPSSIAGRIKQAIDCSPFLKRLLERNDDLLNDLQFKLDQSFSLSEMQAFISAHEVVDEPSLKRVLRQLRQSVIARLIVRDINGLADLSEVMLTTSLLAETAVQIATKTLTDLLAQDYGFPSASPSDPGKPQSLIVIGMGKLGGYELNVSSDIDLIFAYACSGETDGAESISNQSFFTKLAKRLISAIDDVTEDGFVFRVDMRLRPFGNDGLIVSSLEAIEDYYQKYGREWERYAWIKGRVINGDNNLVKQLLLPFVFRKYLDFGALASMRDLKKQIQLDVNRRALHDNIKLGSGGIREIEFIAQAFQLMRGGQEPKLQARPTLTVLKNLAALGLISEDVCHGLSKAYIFLRNLEHRLQYYNDAQTHDLPKSDEHRKVIAKAMELANWQSLTLLLSAHRDFVSNQFAQIFATQKQTNSENQYAVDIWDGAKEALVLQSFLEEFGYKEVEDALRTIRVFSESKRIKALPDLSKQRLDILMPVVIVLCGEHDNARETLQRMVTMIETICRRASYMAFFSEYPEVLKRLVAMVSASPWLANYLGQHPLLLDSLTEQANISEAPNLEAQLLEKVAWHDGDVEQQMNVLRDLQQAQLFSLASKDVLEGVPLQSISDKLSTLADTILRVVVKTVWATLKDKHCETPNFAIIAYGKHGGFELGYASDLDMVFLYQDAHPDAREVYSRFGMRIISWLNTMTSSGILYETDMQLRPNGDSGLLVTSIEAFETYQLEKAWAWEHQAITRARFCAGNETIGKAFERIREKVITMPRALSVLRSDVMAMRNKMRHAHPVKTDYFDFKHGVGGMVDIEFIVQYLVLAHAKNHSDLLINSGNYKLLKLCGKYGLIPQTLSIDAAEAYVELRRLQHKMRLQGRSDATVEKALTPKSTKAVLALWHYVFA